MQTLYVVDGSGYIFRAYYAISYLSTKSGLPTNALAGFTKMLLKLIKDVEARYIAVTFDTGAPTFRHEAYPEYKANRAACPEDLVPQMPYFRKIVNSLGLKMLEANGYEADDVIATIVKRFQSQIDNVVIVSGDKDLTQLVNERVCVWDPMRDVRYSPQVVKEKFGVPPENIVDFLALSGDSSDNVPGVKGVGPKTAAQLIDNFGSVESLISRLNEVESMPGLRGAKRIGSLIESNVDLLRLSRTLVQLKDDVPQFVEKGVIEDYKWAGPIWETLMPLCQELEFGSVVSQLSAMGIVGPALKLVCADKPQRSYSLVTKDSLNSFISELSKQSVFAFDTETTSLDVTECNLVGISFCWKNGEAWYLPFLAPLEETCCLQWVEVQKLLAPIFSSQSIMKVGFNLKYDIAVLLQHGIEVQGQLFDSFIADAVLHPDSRPQGLKKQAKALLGEDMETFENLTGGSAQIVDVPLEQACHYACHDADASWRLMSVYSDKLGLRGDLSVSLRAAFEDIEMPLVPVLARLELAGIKVDMPFLDSLELEFGAELETLEHRIHSEAGKSFNINSPKQLATVLFEDLGISTKGVKRTQSSYSTDASVLAKLVDAHPIVEWLLEYRELFKLQSTYVNALRKLARPNTHRVHSSFNQAVTATGRLSSSEPNLQNIPIRNPRGKKIRNAFIAENEHLLIKADYSQIELRVLAHLSEDESLQSAFRSNKDIHLETAIELFGSISLEGDDKQHLRRIAKTINFGIIYGMGAFRLASELKISRTEAQRYIDNYFAKYPRVQKYFKALEQQVNELGYVQTLFGRRRFAHDIDVAGRDTGYVMRSLLNAPIQGTAAEIMKLAMVRLDASLKEFAPYARIVLQVHDELVCEVHKDIVQVVQAKVVEQMEQAVSLAVPLKVDVSVGASWGVANE